MLFKAWAWPGLRDGSITMTVRPWTRPQAKAGGRYHTAAGMLEVEAVDVVPFAAITDEDARRCGFADRTALAADLKLTDATTVHRVRFHHIGEDDRSVLAAEDELTDADVEVIKVRLDRLDRASTHGPWTRETLALIARLPEVRAGDLAAELGRETQPFKIDVRKLKALGLTQSLERGYRLSPRGRAYARRTAIPGA
jgi:hypothetical protein